MNLSNGSWETQTFAGEVPDYRYGATGIYLTSYPKCKIFGKFIKIKFQYKNNKSNKKLNNKNNFV